MIRWLPIAGVVLSGCLVSPADVVPGMAAVRGSGVAAKEERSIAGVTAVELRGVGTLTVTVADEEKLTVTADDNILPLIVTEAKDDTLTIGFGKNTSVNPVKPVTYDLTVKSLRRLKLSGAARVVAHKLDGKKFQLDISGACHANLDGNVGEFTLTVSGTAAVDARELAAGDAAVTVSGASNVKVNVKDKLSVRASGASSVRYRGDPKQVESKRSGVSSVSRE